MVDEILTTVETVPKLCMTTTGPVGINSREIITLIRLFMLARRLNAGWPAVATKDERQVSISSLREKTIKPLTQKKSTVIIRISSVSVFKTTIFLRLPQLYSVSIIIQAAG